jgi:O-methyltransferase involved in polyketide biosynthesis
MPIDFARDSLADRLAVWGERTAPVVIMEGVSMYLRPEAMQSTLRVLKQAYPDHVLVCDLMTRTFARRYGSGLRTEIARLGGDFAERVDDPSASVTAAGYTLVDKRSIAQSAVDFGTVAIPRWLLATVLRSLRDGFQVCTFEASA